MASRRGKDKQGKVDSGRRSKTRTPDKPDALEASSEAREEIRQIEEEITAQFEDQLALKKEEAGLLEKRTEQEQKLLDITTMMRDVRKQIAEETKKGWKTDAAKAKLKALALERLATQKLVEVSNKLKDSEDELATSIHKSTTSLLEAATGIKTSGNAMTGLIKQMGEGSSAGDLLGKTFKASTLAASGANIMYGITAGVMSKFAEATLSAAKTSEQLMESLGRDTGIARTRTQIDAIRDMADETNNAAISQESLGATMGELQVATKGIFGNLAKGSQGIAVFAEEMRSTGVATQATGELFTKFGKILGKDAVPEIKGLEENVVKLAKHMGMSANDMVRDVADMADSLAAYGDASKNIALDIAEISAVTKLGSKDILKFTKSFEFMPDALNKANELNLTFGRAVIDGEKMWQMMNDGTKGPGEAFKYALTSMAPLIDDAFLHSVPKMRAFADNLGMNEADAARLAKTLKKVADAGGDVGAEIKKQTASYKTEQEALQGVTNMWTQLEAFQRKFAISLSPLADGIAEVLEWFNKLEKSTVQAIFVGVATVAAGVGYWLTTIVKRTKEMTKEMVSGAKAMTKDVAKLAGSLGVVATELAAINALKLKGGVGGGDNDNDLGDQVEEVAGVFGGGDKKKGSGKKGGTKGFGAKAGGIAAGVGAVAGIASGFMDEGSTAQKVTSAVGDIAGMAGTGAMIGSIFPGIGTGIGAAVGGLVGLGMAAMDDGVITMTGGKANVTKINNRDDVNVIAKKPGGPLDGLGLDGAGGMAGGAMMGAALGPVGMMAGAMMGKMMSDDTAKTSSPAATETKAVEIVVNLFGKELVRQLVDLVDEEQKDRAQMNSILMGAK